MVGDGKKYDDDDDGDDDGENRSDDGAGCWNLSCRHDDPWIVSRFVKV